MKKVLLSALISTSQEVDLEKRNKDIDLVHPDDMEPVDTVQNTIPSLTGLNLFEDDKDESDKTL